MNKTELLQALSELRQEIEQLEDGDDDTRARLCQLTDLMEVQLEQHAEPDHPSLNRALQEMIEIYEARHPRLTAIANDIMTKLAGMGI